jgi:polyhydroxyalkanoate synthase subunit PhaC
MTTAEDAADQAGAPLDLLLTDAAGSSWRRLLPSASTARFVAGMARNPATVARHGGRLAAELVRIAAGRSDVAPPPKDRRFADEGWTGNPLLHRVLQAYLAAGGTARGLADEIPLPEADALRVQAAVSNLVDALAPSNNPLLNPRALKGIVDTGGRGLLTGARSLVRDLSSAPRVPRMVEPDAFVVGETVAATPGAVVARTPVMELIQYTPTSEQVREIPLVIVPPTINKFYVVDMAPGRSLVEHLVADGHQVFIVSWRNPDARHKDWDLDTYGEAILTAMAEARAITGAESTSLLALCSGGIITSMVLGHLAARGALDLVAAAALSVTVLDQRGSGLPGALLTPASAEAAIRASAARGYLDGRSLAEVFAWLRPNDLIWNYWVESYLLGKPTKPFDVLFWNSDTTRMTAGLHRDFIRLTQANALVDPGASTMLGSPVDLGAVDCDTYVTAGIADHLCAWQSCYSSTQMFGGKSRFVLSTSGHIASIVNPPGNKKAHFRVNDATPLSPEEWLAGASTVEGSWWPDFSTWLHERSGAEVPAPAELGDATHPPLAAAPGEYVRAS